jgi:FdrA protein
MGSPSTTVDVRRGAYHDSVTLMQVSRSVSTVDGVQAALVAMATELNLDLLDGMGFPAPEGAGPNDLMVAIRADDDEAVARGKAELDAALARSSAGGSGSGGLGAAPAPGTTGSAARRTGANLALVSVPGPHAFSEAMDALDAGLNVMIFSDNVPVEQEIRLKDEGAKRGLLVMGPDCGSAAVAGVGLGFANSVRRGPVGMVAASGSGAQQLMCLLDAAGVGVSHCLGVGGRDLSAAVGGRSTRQALAMLDEDSATELVIVVSKPPAKEVADEITAYAEGLATPVQRAFLGTGRPNLTAAAQRAVETVGGSWPQLQTWTPTSPPALGAGSLRGLFAGGTLCDEAMVIAAQELGPIRSNIPLQPDWALPDDLRAEGHTMIDFGDDRLTQGRAHPMIDQRSRLERIAAEGTDPDTAVLLLDVVLGYGGHADPASELAPALADAVRTAQADGRSLAVVVSLCGTEGDLQGLARQGEALAAAGAVVYRSNAEAARAAAALTRENR